MLKINLLEQMLIISIALSTISCSFVQKTKRYFPCSSCLCFYSLFVNIVMGLLFCISFTSITFPMSLWIGVFSFVGADTIYNLHPTAYLLARCNAKEREDFDV